METLRDLVDKMDNKRNKVTIVKAGDVDSSLILWDLSALLGRATDTFRFKGQEAAVRHALGCSEEDTNKSLLAILPTGCGNSASYLLAAVRKGMVQIVIVPLVALIDDTLRKCRAAGVNDVAWGGREGLGFQLVIASMAHVATGDEYGSFVLRCVGSGTLVLVALDEVHLVSVWASFSGLVMNNLANRIVPESLRGKVRVLALTGTAPPSLVPDILTRFGMNGARVVRETSVWPNLAYTVEAVSNLSLAARLLSKVSEYLARAESVGSGRGKSIAYGLGKDDVDCMTSTLDGALRNVGTVNRYHAGMASQHKMESFDTWSAATGLAVTVATSAFGCGVDDPDVGLVVFVGRPRNVIELDQAAGRAGRDGKTHAEYLVLVPVGELHCRRRPAVASVSEELAAECHPVARGSSSDFGIPG
jgi:ATP-dependent DNA helicase RecQ